jgi:TolB protein
MRRRVQWQFAVLLMLVALCHGAGAAPLAIEIIGGGANQIPITVVPFAGEERFVNRVGQIIAADLQRSGLFRLGSVGSVRPLPAEPTDINYRYWKNEGTETMVIGSVIERYNG